MRVIAGELRSRRIKPVPGRETRPTPDRLRESLFNILGGEVAGTTFVDVYAGSGAVGIEALSRGASHAVFVERSRPATRVIEENLQDLGLKERGMVVAQPASVALKRLQGDIFFVDPPYNELREYVAALDVLGETEPPLVVVQHPPRMKLRDVYGGLRRYRTVTHGSNSLSFYQPAREEPESRETAE